MSTKKCDGYRPALREGTEARIYFVKAVYFATSKASHLCLVATRFCSLFRAINWLGMVLKRYYIAL